MERMRSFTTAEKTHRYNKYNKMSMTLKKTQYLKFSKLGFKNRQNLKLKMDFSKNGLLSRRFKRKLDLIVIPEKNKATSCRALLSISSKSESSEQF